MLKIVSIVCFFTLSIVLISGYQVAYIVEATNGVDPPTTETKYLIKDNGEWLGWVFLVIAIFASFMFFVEMLGMR